MVPVWHGLRSKPKMASWLNAAAVQQFSKAQRFSQGSKLGVRSSWRECRRLTWSRGWIRPENCRILLWSHLGVNSLLPIVLFCENKPRDLPPWCHGGHRDSMPSSLIVDVFSQCPRFWSHLFLFRCRFTYFPMGIPWPSPSPWLGSCELGVLLRLRLGLQDADHAESGLMCHGHGQFFGAWEIMVYNTWRRGVFENHRWPMKHDGGHHIFWGMSIGKFRELWNQNEGPYPQVF